jgi:hypothetical protein
MLTDAQIAVLCDVGQASSFDEKKKREVVTLLAQGYLEKGDKLSPLRLTKMGEKALENRGAGLNES